MKPSWYDMRTDHERSGYVICTAPRSGSNFLCALLTADGALGRPAEYFGDNARFKTIEHDPTAFERMLVAASTPNGIYGIKVFPNQFDLTCGSHWPLRLPNLHFISLRRQDMLGQAISYVRARQTGQYRSSDPQRGGSRYDGAAIAQQLRRIAEAEWRWRLYFARNGISPLLMSYENILLDPAGAVATVAAHLGRAPAEGRLPIDGLAIQRDALSDEWRARFAAEAADIGYLDHPLGQMRVRLRRAARTIRSAVNRVGTPSK